MPRLAGLRPHRPLLLGAIALAGLLAALAVLQYRWLGQVSEAEASRLRAGARARRSGSRASSTARSPSRSCGSAPTATRRPLPGVGSSGCGFRLTRAWSRAVGLVRDGRLPPLRRGRGGVRARGLARPAPARAGALRGAVLAPPVTAPPASAAGRPARPGSPRARSRPVFPPVEEERGLVTSVSPASAASVVLLDEDYLRDELLPELAARHFAAEGDSDYGLRVDRSENPADVVFASDPGIPPEDPPTSPSGSSASASDALAESDRALLPGPPARGTPVVRSLSAPVRRRWRPSASGASPATGASSCGTARARSMPWSRRCAGATSRWAAASSPSSSRAPA